ncbi:hypothetical protein [Pseudomonas sp.]|uniref:hypothetical protein n=1 Tax=Pseudomonas sp. TaxID=306 RepID=UPI00261613F7|nr:hypothetical protein [Pseudomonas sp.]
MDISIRLGKNPSHAIPVESFDDIGVPHLVTLSNLEVTVVVMVGGMLTNSVRGARKITLGSKPQDEDTAEVLAQDVALKGIKHLILVIGFKTSAHRLDQRIKRFLHHLDKKTELAVLKHTLGAL